MKKLISWILVLPGAVTIAICCNYLIKFIFTFSIWKPGFLFYDVDNKIILCIQSLIFPICFLMSGMKIAPSNKRMTGVFLLLLFVLLIISIVLLRTTETYDFSINDYLFLFFTGVGGIAALFLVPKNNIYHVKLIRKQT